MHIFILIRNNKEDPKFKVGDHVSISKYKNIYAKGYVPNWSEEAFAIKKGPLLLAMLKVRKLLKCLMEKKCIKQIKKNLG